MQRGVGVAVSTSVEPVAVGFAAGGGDGAYAAEFGEGGLAVDAMCVVAQDEQELSGVIGADAHRLGQLGASWSVRARSRCSWSVISSLRESQRRAMARRVCLVAAATVVSCPDRSADCYRQWGVSRG